MGIKLSNYTYYQIDKGFRPIIKTLNEKGWITCYCCEGHIDKLTKKSERWSSYIAFKEVYNFPIPIPLFPIRKKGEPKSKIKGCYSELHKTKKIFHWYGSKGTTMLEKEAERIKWLNDFKEWAEKLPYLE